MLVGPWIAKLDEIVSKQLYKSDTPENPVYVTLTANHITAFLNLSKGYKTISLISFLKEINC